MDVNIYNKYMYCIYFNILVLDSFVLNFDYKWYIFYEENIRLWLLIRGFYLIVVFFDFVFLF